MESSSLPSTLSLLALWIAASWTWGRAFLPLSRHIFPNSLDGGLAAGRLLALVLVALVAFEGAALHIVSLQFSPLLMLAAPLALQLYARRDAVRFEEYRNWARSKSRDLAVSDVVFVGCWLIFAWIRLRNPGLSDLEKPMDIGLLASASRASWLPFENWWMAGVPFTNYYYFGPLMGSLPTRALATPPHIAYNLVQPLFCAMFASVLAAVAASLCWPRDDEGRPFSRIAWARGVWVASIVSILGNFEPLRQMQQAGRWLWPSEIDWWKTSRVIEHTINEYPAFTQATGDIHAHFYALSMAALLFSLAWSLFARTQAPLQVLEEAPPEPKLSSSAKKRRTKARAATATSDADAEEPVVAPTHVAHEEAWLRWARVLCLGALLGALIAGNTWDVPLYALVSIGSLYLSQRARAETPFRWAALAQQIGVMLALAVALALPYLSKFRSQVSGVQREFWLPNATEWALMWSGILLLALLSVAGSRRVGDERRRLWQVLAACGALALIAPSVFYIRGAFGDGPDRHQDTVFKFGLHAWLLLGTSGACGAWWLLDSWRRTQRRVATIAWGAAWTIPLLCTLGVVWMRTVSMQSPISPSLDGSFPNDDARGIAWLSANAPSGSVVLEAARAATNEPNEGYYGYNEFGRVASLTGVPTPVGWTSHLGYWGADYGRDVLPRLQSVRAAWAAPDAQTARAILGSLHVTHIFIGEIERRTYTPQAIDMMKSLGRVAFDNGATIIELPHS